jgi:predicted transcriptional regulator
MPQEQKNSDIRDSDPAHNMDHQTFINKIEDVYTDAEKSDQNSDQFEDFLETAKSKIDLDTTENMSIDAPETIKDFEGYQKAIKELSGKAQDVSKNFDELSTKIDELFDNSQDLLEQHKEKDDSSESK